MDDKEKLKLTDFLDPIIQLAIGMAIAGDILFFILPLRYIFAVIISMIFWPGFKGFITKLIFAICIILPLPLMTVGTIVAALLSNSFIRFVAVQLGIAVLTGGVGNLAEAGVFVLETAGKEVVARGAGKAVGAVAGEKAGEVVGAAAGAATGKVASAAKGVASEAVGETAEAVSKPIGPSAQPPEMEGPQAQPEEAKKPSLKERAKKKVIEKGKGKLSEKLAEEEEPEEAQENEEESNVIEGEFGNPDVGSLQNEEEEEDDGGTVDLRKAA